MAALDHALSLLQHHVGDLDVPLGGLVEGGGDDLRVDAALHIGDLLWTLVDEQYDEVDLRVVSGNGVGDVFQQDGLTGLGLGHDEAALSLANRGEEIDDAGGQVAALMPGEVDLLVGEHRGEVVERNTVADVVGIAAVDFLDLGEREVLLAALGRADGAIDGVAVFEAEELDLGERHVDVVRRGEVIVVGGAQETAVVAGDFEHALGHHSAFVLRFGQLGGLLF